MNRRRPAGVTPPAAGKVAVTVGDLVRALVVDASEQQIIDRAVRSAVGLVGVSGAGVTLLTADGPGAMAASNPTAYALERLQARMNEGPCMVAVRDGAACLSPDVVEDPRFTGYGPAAVSAGARGVFAFPLRFDERPLGALDLYRPTAQQLTGGEVAAAQLLCDVVAVLLVNARARATREHLSAQLQAAVDRDPLTGLPDRNLLLDRLQQALHRSDRSGRRVGVMFIDLDGFKAINDQHGHAVGDLLLGAFADRLGVVLRPSDTLARWGGDEFVIVMDDLADDDGPEQLHARVDAQLVSPFALDGITIRVSASLGSAVSAGGADTPARLIGAADQAMYAAKRRAQESDGHRRPSSAPPDPFLDPWPLADSTAAGEPGWIEFWIEEPTPRGGAFAHVIAHPARGELLVTELDDRALIVARYEWAPLPPDQRAPGATCALTVTDWDGQEVAHRTLAAVPDPPHDHIELRRLLADATDG